VKIFRVISILSGLFICIILMSISLGWINFFSTISPLMIGFFLLAFSTAINLNRFEQIGLKWIAFSLALIGFLILLFGVFQIIPLKSFWHYGMATISSSLIIGLFSQTQLINQLNGKFYYFSLLMTMILLIIIALIALRIESTNVYYFGKIVLTIFSLFVIFGSIIKLKKSNL
jgi:hypothetical protein